MENGVCEVGAKQIPGGLSVPQGELNSTVHEQFPTTIHQTASLHHCLGGHVVLVLLCNARCSGLLCFTLLPARRPTCLWHLLSATD
jgi:hypothetical protein